MPDPDPDIRIVLRPLPSSRPLEQRLKALLKYALRALRLKCLAVEPVEQPKKGVNP
jgi:hypothetical protein